MREYSRGLRCECVGTGIRVTDVQPGDVFGDFTYFRGTYSVIVPIFSGFSAASACGVSYCLCRRQWCVVRRLSPPEGIYGSRATFRELGTELVAANRDAEAGAKVGVDYLGETTGGKALHF